MSSQVESPSPFTAEQRRIFQYFNGDKHVFADPIDINRRIYYKLPDPDRVVERCNPEVRKDGEVVKVHPPEVVFEAEEQLIEAIRFAFNMPPINPETGAGATYDDCMRAWEDYCFFCNVSRPSIDTSQTLPQPSPPCGCPENSSTTPSSVSG